MQQIEDKTLADVAFDIMGKDVSNLKASGKICFISFPCSTLVVTLKKNEADGFLVEMFQVAIFRLWT